MWDSFLWLKKNKNIYLLKTHCLYLQDKNIISPVPPVQNIATTHITSRKFSSNQFGDNMGPLNWQKAIQKRCCSFICSD